MTGSARTSDPAAANLTPILLIACAATFLVYLDAAIVNLAFGAIAAAFPDTSQHTMTWIATGFAVAFAAGLAVGGHLADTLGHRRLLLVGALGFGLASAACAAAPTAGMLIAARVAQGGTGALLLPAALGGLLAAAPASRAAAVIGAWGASGSFAAVLGPGVGAELVDLAGWRWLFLINVPASLLLVAACARLPQPGQLRREMPDLPGALLLSGGLAAVVVAISQSSRWGYHAPLTLSLGALGLLAGAATLWRSRSQQVPVIPIPLLTDRVFAGASLVNAALGAALFTNMLAVPLFLTTVWHLSLVQAGGAIGLVGVAAMAGAVATGRYAGPNSARWFAAAGMALMSVETAVLASHWFGSHRSWPLWTVLAVVAGIGVGVAVSALSICASTALDTDDMAVGMGVTLTARQLGGTVGLAVLAAVLTSTTSPGFVDSFHRLFCGLAVCTLAIAIATVPLLRIRAAAPAQQVAAPLVRD
ncbi:MFS transporter [Nocardia sp. NPDC059246]|uniref:MFS transporter n=1 Tax=unclassified Nocardia TaxID=2637762 RepID=UPI0036C2D23F